MGNEGYSEPEPSESGFLRQDHQVWSLAVLTLDEMIALRKDKHTETPMGKSYLVVSPLPWKGIPHLSFMHSFCFLIIHSVITMEHP